MTIVAGARMVGRWIGRAPVTTIAVVGLATGLVTRYAAGSPLWAERIFLATLVLGGAPLVATTLRGLLRGRFAADVVATLAILAALALGQYFAGAVIVLMQSGGEALEAFAFHRASQAVDALLARAPKLARRLDDGRLVEIPVEQVAVDDVLAVRPGDLVPVDAVVLEGRSAVDQSALTGEPLPARAEPGVELMSGSVNLDGALKVRALRTSAESQYQQIVHLVEEARRDRPPIQRIADRYAVWFTPLAIGMCVITYALTHSPTNVLAVLVVATPCPLILATPVAVIAGISRAAEQGVIVKAGSAIEQIGRVRAVVFDKTGTLTIGHPTVAHLHAANGVSENEVLQLAASVEQLSSHHLGAAVVAAAEERGLSVITPSAFHEEPGSGVAANVGGRNVIVGSAAFLTAHGIATDGGARATTIAYVGVDGAFAGAIEFADQIRDDAPALVAALPALGVAHVALLTGDREPNAVAIGRAVGIDDVRAELLPADKVLAVRDLKRAFGSVLMVGDGINDAPALATATVGVAMGAHAPAASAAAADIVLLVDDVSRVHDAMLIGRHMRRVAVEGIAIGLGVSFLLMVIASFGYILPAVGALLQEALDTVVILNALRARSASAVQTLPALAPQAAG